MRVVVDNTEWTDLTNAVAAAPGDTIVIQNVTNYKGILREAVAMIEFSGDSPPSPPRAGMHVYTQQKADAFAAGAGERVWGRAVADDVELEVQF